MSGPVRVLLYHLTADADGLEEAYHSVSEVLAGGRLPAGATGCDR